MVKIGSLKSYSDARNQLARLIKSFHQGEIEQGDFRALVYGFSALLNYFKFEKDMELEQRIERLERAFDGTDQPPENAEKILRDMVEKARDDVNRKLQDEKQN